MNELRCAFCHAVVAATDQTCPSCGGYPEHKKLRKVQAQSQACGDFLEWLRSEKGYTLCAPHQHASDCSTPTTYGDESLCICGMRSGEYFPASISRVRLLAEFFEIDVDKIEEEKCRLLEEQRKSNMEIQAEAMADKGAG